MKPRDESRTFRNMFTHPHAVLPVIHVESELQALRNAERALTGGADGVFLINHSTSSESLLATHAAAADRFPDFWIGVNCLDLHPAEVFSQISPHHQPDRLCACAHARRFSIRRRAYAAYGGIYIAASLVWLWLVEGQAPTRSDLAVAAAFAGVGVRVDYSTAYDRAA